MQKWLVTVTVDTTATTTIDVLASSADEANERALAEARDNPSAFDWVQDDGVMGEPYLPDSDSTEPANS